MTDVRVSIAGLLTVIQIIDTCFNPFELKQAARYHVYHLHSNGVCKALERDLANVMALKTLWTLLRWHFAKIDMHCTNWLKVLVVWPAIKKPSHTGGERLHTDHWSQKMLMIKQKHAIFLFLLQRARERPKVQFFIVHFTLFLCISIFLVSINQ